MMTLRIAVATALLASTSIAQDPASGWMAYAVGHLDDSIERITRLEMEWKVGAEPKSSRAFFSPWFGMDPDDNLNLVQPVNPWSGSSWSMYTEYYQWSPTHNSNSKSFSVEAGQTLHGSIVYDEAADSYLLSQTILETGDVSSQTVACQTGKTYRLPYIVYEKTFPCADYPPDEVVMFNITAAECDGKDCIEDIKWEANVKDDNCDMKANILSQNQISITWNTKAESRFDNFTRAELIKLNGRGSAWAEQAALALSKHEELA